MRRALEKNRPPHFPWFCLAAAALVVPELWWALDIDDARIKTLRSAAERLRPNFYWVDSIGHGIALVFLLSVIGGLLVALLFSDQHAVRPRHAWIAFVAWGAAMTAINLWSLTIPAGGYADLSGAVWYDRHGEIDRRPWSAARGIEVGCKKLRKHGGQRFEFDVAFDGRTARLANRWGVEDMRLLLRDLRGVESAIPRDAAFARQSFEWRCVAHHAQNLSREESRDLIALFRPRPDHARWVTRESPAWGGLVGEVVETGAEAGRRDAR